MRGHAPILKMRLAGLKPTIVFMSDCLTPISKDWHNPGEKYGEVWPADYATVEFEPTESIELLDLRFVHGIKVSISCETQQRAKELASACKLAGATIVVATHTYFVTPFRCESGWSEIWLKEIVNG